MPLMTRIAMGHAHRGCRRAEPVAASVASRGPTTLVLSAYHEAGHAVAYYVVGIDVGSVTLAAGAGSTQGPAGWAFNQCYQHGGVRARYAEWRGHLARLLMLRAGAQAAAIAEGWPLTVDEQFFRPPSTVEDALAARYSDRDPGDLGADRDLRTAWGEATAMWMDMNPVRLGAGLSGLVPRGGVRRIFDAGRLRARRMLLREWRAVEAVTEALLARVRRGKAELIGSEVAAILAPLARRRWRSTVTRGGM